MTLVFQVQTGYTWCLVLLQHPSPQLQIWTWELKTNRKIRSPRVCSGTWDLEVDFGVLAFLLVQLQRSQWVGTSCNFSSSPPRQVKVRIGCALVDLALTQGTWAKSAKLTPPTVGLILKTVATSYTFSDNSTLGIPVFFNLCCVWLCAQCLARSLCQKTCLFVERDLDRASQPPRRGATTPAPDSDSYPTPIVHIDFSQRHSCS